MIDPSVSLTPKSFTPDKGEEDEDAREERVGQVRELCPLLLQCEQRRVMVALSAESTPSKAESDNQKQYERIVYLYIRGERVSWRRGGGRLWRRGGGDLFSLFVCLLE
jgi:hypothetical protein